MNETPSPIDNAPFEKQRISMTVLGIILMCGTIGALLWFGRNSLPAVSSLFATSTPTAAPAFTLTSTSPVAALPSLTNTPKPTPTPFTVVVPTEEISFGPNKCNLIALIKSFAAPAGGRPHGMAFDGTFLWVAGYDTDKLYKLDTSGNIVSTIPAPGPSPTGLEFDGFNLWCANDAPPSIYQLNTSGDVLFSFSAPGNDSTGLAYDGKYLWNSDFNWDVPGGFIHRIDVSDPNDINFTSFASPGEGPEGLAYDGKYLWNVDFENNTIYKLDMSANILCTYSSYGTNPIGLTFDGKYLWMADFTTQMIYKIDIGYK